jgi:outer membrane protein TolC
LALVFSSLSGQILAAEKMPSFEPSRAYDLGSLVELAMANNPKTRSALFSALAAEAAAGEARSPYWPQLSAQFLGGYDKWYTPATEAPDFFRRQQATTVLSLEYLLLDFGRRAADVSRAVALFEASGLLFDRKVQEVVFAVQSRYFAHEAALTKESAAVAMLEAAGTAMETTRLEVENGLSARPELLRSKRNLINAEYELAAARALSRNTLGDLCVAVGLPANAPVKLSAKTSPATTAPLREDVGGLIQKALAIRPDLAAKAEEVRASEAATRRAGADFLPEVRLEGNYAYSAFQYDSETGPKSNSNAAGINGYGAFLNVEWDLFDGFERVERLRKKSAEEQAARENLAAAQLDASRDVWTTYHDTLSAARRVDSAEAFVASAQENFSAIEASSRTGLSQVAELAEAAGLLAEARFARAEALAVYSTTLAELALAVGAVK